MIKNISKIFFTTILGKLFGFLKIMLLIQFYGTNSLTDALIITISIYWFWSNIVVYSLFSVSLIPSLANIKSQKLQLFKTLRTIYSVNFISIFIFIAVLFLSKEIIYIFAPMNNQIFIENSNLLMIIMSPLLFLIPTTEIFTILNQYNNRMITASINLTIWNIFQVLAILISFYFFKDNIYLVYFFGIFTLFGYIISSYIQLKASKYLEYFNFKNLFYTSFSSTRKSIINNYKFFLSVLLTQLNLYIDNFFISGLDAGYISKYNIIIKVPELVQSILISALVVVFFNKIINDKEKIKAIFIKFTIILLPLLVIGIIIVHFFGVDILYMIYSKKAFLGLDYFYIQKILYIITINVFLMIFIALLVKVFIANNKSKILLLASLFNVCINIISNYLLIDTYGIFGISMATLISSYILYSILISSAFKFNITKKLLLIIIFIFGVYFLWRF
jgi:putative peptidoglycan lipid II flippase